VAGAATEVAGAELAVGAELAAVAELAAAKAKYNNQLATVAMDGAMATRRQRQWRTQR
jgi:hypothetical protein